MTHDLVDVYISTAELSGSVPSDEAIKKLREIQNRQPEHRSPEQIKDMCRRAAALINGSIINQKLE